VSVLDSAKPTPAPEAEQIIGGIPVERAAELDRKARRQERIAKHINHRTAVTTFGVVCSECNEIVELEPDDVVPDMFGGFAPDDEELERRGQVEFVPLNHAEVRLIRDGLNKWQQRVFIPAKRAEIEALWQRLRIFAGPPPPKPEEPRTVLGKLGRWIEDGVEWA
jgi:hypothetical protein